MLRVELEEVWLESGKADELGGGGGMPCFCSTGGVEKGRKVFLVEDIKEGDTWANVGE